ncbi:MAG TPA: hypothetical protein VJ813_06825 [Vicinamibacterales bacterium]|nr:hypothetical protein [Vicinamibacterales bacterium]
MSQFPAPSRPLCTTFVSPLLDLPPTYRRLPDETSTRRMVAGGPTAGMVVFVRVTRHLTVAHELRWTSGLITDGAGSTAGRRSS